MSEQFGFEKLESASVDQIIFDYPDFVEMRPLLRSAVRQVAREGLKEPFLPVELERLTVTLEEQLERETRKYIRQAGIHQNQQAEFANLIRLYTRIMQELSRQLPLSETGEDTIYGLRQTQGQLRQLAATSLPGEGHLFADNQDRELVEGTFYYLVAQQLITPYLIDPAKPLTPQNVQKEGRHLMLQMTTYAFRDWDAYLTHQYDEQHALANQRGLSTVEYYDRLEALELKYIDQRYAEVLADIFAQLEHELVPTVCPQISIQVTDLRPLFAKAPLVRLKFHQAVKEGFKLDATGKEHVLDQPIEDIQQKYAYYRATFLEEDD